MAHHKKMSKRLQATQENPQCTQGKLSISPYFHSFCILAKPSVGFFRLITPIDTIRILIHLFFQLSKFIQNIINTIFA